LCPQLAQWDKQMKPRSNDLPRQVFPGELAVLETLTGSAGGCAGGAGGEAQHAAQHELQPPRGAKSGREYELERKLAQAEDTIAALRSRVDKTEKSLGDVHSLVEGMMERCTCGGGGGGSDAGGGG
jgi:hypothetical protein